MWRSLLVLTACLLTIRSNASMFATESVLLPDFAPSDSMFGSTIAIDGTTAAVGAPYSGISFVRIFERNGQGSWAPTQTIDLGFQSGSSTFGLSVALKGDLLVVGRQGNRAHLYRRVAGKFVNEATLTLDLANGPAVATDGQLVLVAMNEGPPTSSGNVKVFRKVGGTWSAIQTLTDPSPIYGGRFGKSLALQGSALIVGASGQISPTGAGKAYVYSFDGLAFHHTQTLRSSTPTDYGAFGFSMHLDNDRLAIGAPGERVGGSPMGSCHVFRKIGPDWVAEARLTSAVPQMGAEFGWTVQFFGDSLFVGAPFHDDSSISDRGAVFRFAWSNPNWVSSYATYGPGSSSGMFGYCVAKDEMQLWVGQPRLTDDYFSRRGEVSVFNHDAAEMQRVQILVPAGEDVFTHNDSSFARALTGNDKFVFVGVPQATLGTNSNSGYIAVFRNQDGPGDFVQRLETSPIAPYELFGLHLSCDDRWLAVSGSSTIQLFDIASEPFTPALRLTGLRNPIAKLVGGRLYVGRSDAGRVDIYDEIGGIWTFTEHVAVPDFVGFVVGDNWIALARSYPVLFIRGRPKVGFRAR